MQPTNGPDSSRAARWTLAASLAFVVAAISALVLAPFVTDRYVEPLRTERQAVAEPGRGSTSQIQVALALQVGALHDYLNSGDSALLIAYRAGREQEAAAHGSLAPLVERLGERVRERYAELRDLERRWHAAAEDAIRKRGRRSAREARLEQELYEDVVLAAARLDEALEAAVRGLQDDILKAERIERRVGGLLGLIGLAALGVVVWLGLRVRAYATAAEEGRQALERVMESKARLTRGISHDLKNPLNAIDGYAALLEGGIGGELNAQQRGSIERIRRNVRSLLTLITDLLELSRAEVGELRVERKETDVRALMRDAVEAHEAEARLARHSLSIHLADELPPVPTDPSRVRQVVGNLLSNAIKYTPEGGVIEVRAELRRADGQRRLAGRSLAIDVIDTGPGIPPDMLEHVFAEFTRIDGTGRPGAGLGLAIARRIARLLGGDITLASELGRGSRFTLWLPTAADTADPAPAGDEQHAPSP